MVSAQLHPRLAFLPIFDYPGVTRGDALPRWRRSAPPTLGFKNALQKPTSDVTDTTSIFFTVYGRTSGQTLRMVDVYTLLFKHHVKVNFASDDLFKFAKQHLLMNVTRGEDPSTKSDHLVWHEMLLFRSHYTYVMFFCAADVFCGCIFWGLCVCCRVFLRRARAVWEMLTPWLLWEASLLLCPQASLYRPAPPRHSPAQDQGVSRALWKHGRNPVIKTEFTV